ncbi:hydrogenase nickel incorporation protein HypB [Clostridium sardiniense]|uniref:Hydrogenase nickel incorporation protein HypB n=1 Tax=Clostridium sardiniense TaxID=29369 RepID=A0ABS7KZB6_CLOSR|nr:hydrogenase nickel incorporation protein HypB [Clostridium sardiniense]MBY0756158.1 hydrogenase nickel incorporation protein HypB [Clostridium sardiniense]MDQ0458899.1 hydrogenase nickel incorporation protein HypB [Clostridium sardiniense]
MEIKIVKQIMDWNEECHSELNNKLDNNKVTMINVMGSPGAGKTTFILNLIREFKREGLKVGVIEGDIAGKIDAEKIAKEGIEVVQLNTDGACHIEAESIKNILPSFDLKSLDLIIVENIGNLVCPAEFNIGEHLKIALLSVPEGDDKVEKYPLMFANSDGLIITKSDLKDYFEFSYSKVFDDAIKRNGKIRTFAVNSKIDGCLSEVKEWILSKRNKS